MAGGHAARSARRKLEAIRNGRVPGRRGRHRRLRRGRRHGRPAVSLALRLLALALGFRGLGLGLCQSVLFMRLLCTTLWKAGCLQHCPQARLRRLENHVVQLLEGNRNIVCQKTTVTYIITSPYYTFQNMLI